jgi:hypothetical protein
MLQDFAGAEAALLETYELASAWFDADDPRTLDVLTALVQLYTSWGKREEAARYQKLRGA